MKKIYYTLSAVEKNIGKLSELGYECNQICEGSLGLGWWICLPPDNKHYIFIISEEYLNSQCSTHWIMKCRKLPKIWQRRLDKWRSDNG